MKKAGFRLDRNTYAELSVGDEIKLITDINGVKTEYDVTGGGWEETLLWENEDPTAAMVVTDLTTITEAKKYDYIKFIVTNTSGVNEDIQIFSTNTFTAAELGNSAISFHDGSDYVRKIYRSSGKIKCSDKVYKLGDSTQDATQCIIVSVYGIKA